MDYKCVFAGVVLSLVFCSILPTFSSKYSVIWYFLGLSSCQRVGSFSGVLKQSVAIQLKLR